MTKKNNANSARRKLIPAVGMLVVSAMMLSSSTYAWFSMNKEVSATNIAIKARSSSSLVIGDTVTVGTDIQKTFTVENPMETLYPATHYVAADYATIDTTSPAQATNATNLIFNSNPEAVDAASGYAHDATNAALTYQYVPASATSEYYKDYVVYIATSGEAAMAGQDLKVHLENASALTTDTAKAITVDFYVTSTTKSADATAALGEYKGKISLSELTAANSIQKTVDIVIGDNITIPKNNATNDSDAVLKITMRVYFDGALQKTPAGDGTPATAYVATERCNTTEIPQFTAYFTAAEST